MDLLSSIISEVSLPYMEAESPNSALDVSVSETAEDSSAIRLSPFRFSVESELGSSERNGVSQRKHKREPRPAASPQRAVSDVDDSAMKDEYEDAQESLSALGQSEPQSEPQAEPQIEPPSRKPSGSSDPVEHLARQLQRIKTYCKASFQDQEKAIKLLSLQCKTTASRINDSDPREEIATALKAQRSAARQTERRLEEQIGQLEESLTELRHEFRQELRHSKHQDSAQPQSALSESQILSLIDSRVSQAQKELSAALPAPLDQTPIAELEMALRPILLDTFPTVTELEQFKAEILDRLQLPTTSVDDLAAQLKQLETRIETIRHSPAPHNTPHSAPQSQSVPEDVAAQVSLLLRREEDLKADLAQLKRQTVDIRQMTSLQAKIKEMQNSILPKKQLHQLKTQLLALMAESAHEPGPGRPGAPGIPGFPGMAAGSSAGDPRTTKELQNVKAQVASLHQLHNGAQATIDSLVRELKQAVAATERTRTELSEKVQSLAKEANYTNSLWGQAFDSMLQKVNRVYDELFTEDGTRKKDSSSVGNVGNVNGSTETGKSTNTNGKAATAPRAARGPRFTKPSPPPVPLSTPMARRDRERPHVEKRLEKKVKSAEEPSSGSGFKLFLPGQTETPASSPAGLSGGLRGPNGHSASHQLNSQLNSRPNSTPSSGSTPRPIATPPTAIRETQKPKGKTPVSAAKPIARSTPKSSRESLPKSQPKPLREREVPPIIRARVFDSDSSMTSSGEEESSESESDSDSDSDRVVRRKREPKVKTTQKAKPKPSQKPKPKPKTKTKTIEKPKRKPKDGFALRSDSEEGSESEDSDSESANGPRAAGGAVSGKRPPGTGNAAGSERKQVTVDVASSDDKSSSESESESEDAAPPPTRKRTKTAARAAPAARKKNRKTQTSTPKAKADEPRSLIDLVTFGTLLASAETPEAESRDNDVLAEGNTLLQRLKHKAGGKPSDSPQKPAASGRESSGDGHLDITEMDSMLSSSLLSGMFSRDG